MRILIVEDEKHLNDLLYDYIIDKFEDAFIEQIFDGYQALKCVQSKEYDIILLDVMLPNVDGFEICKKLRERKDTPVIMLSALGDEENQMRGYDLGIDEFVPKPYSPKLVIKKIEAILSRLQGNVKVELHSYGIIDYNLDTFKLFVEKEEIELNNKEWKLFEHFINNKGIVFSRDVLLNKIWGYDYFGGDRTVDTHIKRLRQKLLTASGYVKTVYKTGYKFEK